MTGYEYGNTRLRAMRSRFLTFDDFGAMIASGSIDRLLGMLADTPYGPEVEAALVRTRSLQRLDEAVRLHLAHTLRKMASFYGDEPRERVDLLLHRWDLHNLRALMGITPLLRGPGDVSRLLVPAGRLDESALSELAAQPDVATRIDLMIAWEIPSAEAALTLLRARSEFETTGDSTALESTLARVFAETMNDILGEDDGAATILRVEIDAHNLETALRRRAARLEGETSWEEGSERWVPAGLIPEDVWPQVVEADNREGVAELLTGRRLVEGWNAAVREWVSHGRATQLVDALRRALTAAAVSRFVTGDVLGFDIPLAFTFAKEAETRNLHLIGRGIVHGIPGSELEAWLEVAA